MSGGPTADIDAESGLAAVRAAMSGAVRCADGEVRSCIDGLLARPGKLVRPRLLLLTWRSLALDGRNAGLGADAGYPDAVVRSAAAIELLHMATLVHDDVIDQAATRRGAPSVYAARGARTAVLVGDLLFASAFQLVADQADQRLAGILASSVRAITASEILQMNRIDPDRPGYRQYLHQIIGKTAVLFALSCRAGAELAHADTRAIQHAQRAGYDLGMAFQVIDDTLDFLPDDRQSGKTPGRDLELGLVTLPVIAALRSGASGASELRTLIAKGAAGPADAARARELVELSGGFNEAGRWAGRYTERAKREFGKLPPGPAREALLGLTRELLERRN